MADPIDKVPPPQRVSDEELERLTGVYMQSRTAEATLLVGDLLDLLYDLRDVRDTLKAPPDDPAERVDWHLGQLGAEFAAAKGTTTQPSRREAGKRP